MNGNIVMVGIGIACLLAIAFSGCVPKSKVKEAREVGYAEGYTWGSQVMAKNLDECWKDAESYRKGWATSSRRLQECLEAGATEK